MAMSNNDSASRYEVTTRQRTGIIAIRSSRSHEPHSYNRHDAVQRTSPEYVDVFQRLASRFSSVAVSRNHLLFQRLFITNTQTTTALAEILF